MMIAMSWCLSLHNWLLFATCFPSLLLMHRRSVFASFRSCQSDVRNVQCTVEKVIFNFYKPQWTGVFLFAQYEYLFTFLCKSIYFNYRIRLIKSTTIWYCGRTSFLTDPSGVAPSNARERTYLATNDAINLGRVGTWKSMSSFCFLSPDFIGLLLEVATQSVYVSTNFNVRLPFPTPDQFSLLHSLVLL